MVLQPRHAPIGRCRRHALMKRGALYRSWIGALAFSFLWGACFANTANNGRDGRWFSILYTSTYNVHVYAGRGCLSCVIASCGRPDATRKYCCCLGDTMVLGIRTVRICAAGNNGRDFHTQHIYISYTPEYILCRHTAVLICIGR